MKCKCVQQWSRSDTWALMSLWRIFLSWMCLRPRQIWTNQSTTWGTHSSVLLCEWVWLSPIIIFIKTKWLHNDRNMGRILTSKSTSPAPLWRRFLSACWPSSSDLLRHSTPSLYTGCPSLYTHTVNIIYSEHKDMIPCAWIVLHSPWNELMKATMFGCFIFDNSVTSFLDASFSFADIWAVKTLLIQQHNTLTCYMCKWTLT